MKAVQYINSVVEHELELEIRLDLYGLLSLVNQYNLGSFS